MVRFRPAPLKLSRSSTLVSLRTKQPTVSRLSGPVRRPTRSSSVRMPSRSSGESGACRIEYWITSRRGAIHADSSRSLLPAGMSSPKKVL